MSRSKTPSVFYRVLSRSSARVVAATSIFLLLLPGVLSAQTAADVLSTPDTQEVSRGEFIRAAVKILHVPKSSQKAALPFNRIPRGLLPFLRSASDKGALVPFDKASLINQGITRGEALVVLMKLSGQHALGAKSISAFADVQEDPVLKEAVQLALEKNWIKPLRSTLFGVRKILTGSEARILLSQFAPTIDESAPSVKYRIPVIRVNLTPKGSQALPKESLLQQVWQHLSRSYLYQEKLIPDEAAYKAAEGLVDSLHDPYTVFLRPASAKNFANQIQGEVTGIGAQVEQKDGLLIIVTPLPNSPALHAGLQPGDQIVSADGVSLKGLPFEEAVGHVRGPVGSSVNLRINRNGNEFDVTVIRQKISVPEIEISWQGTIAVVHLYQFGQHTDQDLRADLAEVALKHPTGLILDLRNNPGGLLHAAGITLSNFLPKGSTFALIDSHDGQEIDITDDAPTIDADVQMAVLVNKGSASASEIVAGALQDAKRAILIGEKTYGKGTVQQLIDLDDGSTLKMTIAEWETPKGRKIDGIGIEPDVPVATSTDRDEQMLKALDILR